jgi:hypothetical protein
MADPTAQEILDWALINRARLDPAGEAALYGIDLNEGPVRVAMICSPAITRQFGKLPQRQRRDHLLTS